MQILDRQIEVLDRQIEVLSPDMMKEKSKPRKGIDPFTRDLVPAKVWRIARLIQDNLALLMDGEKIFMARKMAQQGMECRRYVSDEQILNMVKDKLSIVMREDVLGMKTNYFNGGVLKAGWERGLATKEDQDRVIYIQFFKVENLDMATISTDDCVYIKC